MIVKGYIGKALEPHKNATTGKVYYSFRLAENHGRNETRTALWCDVIASIPPLEADMLAVGQVVSAEGRLEVQPYIKKRVLAGTPVPTTWEGVIKCLQDKDALAFGLKLFTQKVLPDHFKKHQEARSETRSPDVRDNSAIESIQKGRTSTKPQEAPGASRIE